MAKEKVSKALKKSISGAKKHPSKSDVKKHPSEVFYYQLRGLFDGFAKDKEKAFKNSERWEYLKNELLNAAKHGIKNISIKNSDEDVGEGKSYAEWEIDLFVNEYRLLYFIEKNKWRIYWF